MIPNSIYQSSRLSHLEDELKELRQLVNQSQCSKNICRNLKKFQKAESAEILRLTTRLTAFENSINAKLAYGQVAFTGTSWIFVITTYILHHFSLKRFSETSFLLAHTRVNWNTKWNWSFIACLGKISEIHVKFDLIFSSSKQQRQSLTGIGFTFSIWQ